MLYWQRPTAEQLAAMPWRKPEDFVEPSFDVWDENWEALNFFIPLSAQLRSGPNGPYALDFSVFFQALDRKGIVGEEFEEYVDKLRIIERAVIAKLQSPA